MRGKESSVRSGKGKERDKSSSAGKDNCAGNIASDGNVRRKESFNGEISKSVSRGRKGREGSCDIKKGIGKQNNAISKEVCRERGRKGRDESGSLGRRIREQHSEMSRKVSRERSGKGRDESEQNREISRKVSRERSNNGRGESGSVGRATRVRKGAGSREGKSRAKQTEIENDNPNEPNIPSARTRSSTRDGSLKKKPSKHNKANKVAKSKDTKAGIPGSTSTTLKSKTKSSMNLNLDVNKEITAKTTLESIGKFLSIPFFLLS